ncbi:MAG: hypothetical protein SVZ03_00270 [Spirochaetota bacterium]|nr:hypothetical protein [Spirochaetota bacterium]
MKTNKFEIFPLIFILFIIILLSPISGYSQLKTEGEDIQDGKGVSLDNDNDGVVFSGADEGEYINMADSGDGILRLSGNIKMDFDGKVLYSQNVDYNRNTGDVTLTGRVIYDDGENRLEAEKAVYNVKDRAGVLYNVKSDKEPRIFNSRMVRIVLKRTYITENVNMTSCDLVRPHYHFRVKKLWIYSGDRLIAFNAIYKVGDVPMFYFPVVVQSEEGFGIITQFGKSNRRGKFAQNTLKYTTIKSNRWKFKADAYEKLGQYGGVEYWRNRDDLDLYLYLAGSKYKYVNEDLDNIPTPEEGNDNWFKSMLNSYYIFNRRKNSNSYCKLNFEWMNNNEFERFFDDRYEPLTTFEMLYRVPTDEINVRNNLNWQLSIGDRGDRHSVSLLMQREWLWDEREREKVKHYERNGYYVPNYDRLPFMSLSYNGSFHIFGDNDKSTNNKRQGQIINWNIFLFGESLEEYREGHYYSNIYKSSGYYNINTVFPLLTFVTYTPEFRLGYNGEWVRGGTFNDNDDDREAREITADKNSYQYIEASNTLRFGLTNYYLQVAHRYRRSFLEREVIEPFIHEKLNYFEGGVYLYPFDGVNMSITTSYEARRKWPFEDERWRNIIFVNNFFFDMYKYLNKEKHSGRGRGLFYMGLNILNNYCYITKESNSGYNTLDLSFTCGNFSVPGIRLIRALELGYSYFHDFRFHFRDMMSLRWKLNADISRYWRVNIEGNSQADRIDRYFDDDVTPEINENLFNDMEESLYFYDTERSGNVVFSFRNLRIDVIHDLHCWELGFYFHINRKMENIGPENRDRLIYYERSYFISISIKSFSDIGLHKMEFLPQKTTRDY